MTKDNEVRSSLEFPDNGYARTLFGRGGQFIKSVESLAGAKISTRGTLVTLSGSEAGVSRAEVLLNGLYRLLELGFALTGPDINYAASILKEDKNTDLSSVFMETVYVSYKKKRIAPKSLNQKRYIDEIRANDIVFGIGPAGTGKTYLAVASAVAALAAKEVDRIILTRPAVEAGEKLGFLPGDMAAKVDPYLRPLYDALHVMLDPDQVEHYLEKGIIEVAPLAFMRGRTLDDSFVILDEAQNTTVDQLKMFLTRLGFGSKAVVTGDITQIDLPNSRASGLVASESILGRVRGISFVRFTDKDVVRHPLVQAVIKAFDRAERTEMKRRDKAEKDNN